MVSQNTLCSPRSIFPQVYVLQTNLHMIPQVYGSPGLCSPTTLPSPLLPQIVIDVLFDENLLLQSF